MVRALGEVDLRQRRADPFFPLGTRESQRRVRGGGEGGRRSGDDGDRPEAEGETGESTEQTLDEGLPRHLTDDPAIRPSERLQRAEFPCT